MARTTVRPGMATDPALTTEAEPEPEAEWLTQEAIREQQDTETTVLPGSNARVRYRPMPPEKFATLVERYNITDMAQNLQDIDPDADLSDTGDVDLANLSPEDLDQFDDQMGIILFFRDVITPQIDRPEQVHWADPDHTNEPGWVDLSELPETDKLHLLAVITGRDPDQLVESAKERVEKFQG